MSGLQQIVRWLKVRTSGRGGRGRSKERSRERTAAAGTPQELPHPSECYSPVKGPAPPGDLPDVLRHSEEAPWWDGQEEVDEEDLLGLERNTPQRRTLPPIPLDQSPYKPGLSSPRQRSSSVDRPLSPTTKTPAPVYEEIPNWAVGEGRCAPYLVVSLPAASDPDAPAEQEGRVNAGYSSESPVGEPLQEEEVCSINQHLLLRHSQEEDHLTKAGLPYTYRYSSNLGETPSKYAGHTDSSPVHSHTDQDSADECYEYDMDSSSGQSASELSTPTKDSDDEDDLGVYPLPPYQGHSGLKVSGGSRSQSDSSNDTYGEYDGGSESNSSFQAEVEKVHQQFLLSRRLAGPQDVMTSQSHVKSYAMTTICHSTCDDVSHDSPPLPPRMKRQLSTPNHRKHSGPSINAAKAFATPPPQRRSSLHTPAQQQVSSHLNSSRCDMCGHSSQVDSTSHQVAPPFTVMDNFVPLPHWKAEHHAPRPTLGVSAMYLRRKSQQQQLQQVHGATIKTLPRTPTKLQRSHDAENEGLTMSHTVAMAPERHCKTRQPFREKARIGSPFMNTPNFASKTLQSRQTGLKFDLPKPNNKLSCRANESCDYTLPVSKTRPRKDVQPRHAQTISSKQHNRLLQDLMQVNFDRQNLATV